MALDPESCRVSGQYLDDESSIFNSWYYFYNELFLLVVSTTRGVWHHDQQRRPFQCHSLGWKGEMFCFRVPNSECLITEVLGSTAQASKTTVPGCGFSTKAGKQLALSCNTI